MRKLASMLLLTACGSAPQQVCPAAPPAPASIVASSPTSANTSAQAEAANLAPIFLLPIVRADLAHIYRQQECVDQMVGKGFDPNQTIDPDCKVWIDEAVAKGKAQKAEESAPK